MTAHLYSLAERREARTRATVANAERAALLDAYARCKAAWLTVPILQAKGADPAFCEELERALFERATRLLAQLGMTR